MAQVLDIVIKNDFDALGGLCLNVNNFLEQNQLGPRAVYAVNLALEEVLTNVLKYGYDDCGVHEIEISLAIEGSGITLTIVDDGRSFDVEQAPDPDMTVPVAQRDVGGLGIFLVRNMLDSLRYNREQGKNVLQITIKGDASCGGAG